MRNLKGQLLVAHPNVVDPAFARTVVYIYRHTAHDVYGLILNQPTTYEVAQLLQEHTWHYRGSDRFYRGGNKGPGTVVLLHDNNWHSVNTLQVGNELAISSDAAMLEKIAHGNTPRNWRLFTGVSHWEPSSIQQELAMPDIWLPVALENSNDVFKQHGVRMWDHAIQACSRQAFGPYI